MDFIIAILMGVVQGLTEFFPISSSGHLVILERLSGFQVPALTFHVFVHMGTLLAVLLTFRRDLSRLAHELRAMCAECFGAAKDARQGQGRPTAQFKNDLIRTNYRKLAVIILVAMIPTGIIGALLDVAIWKTSYSPFQTGVGFLITGVVLLVTDRVAPSNEIPRNVSLNFAWLIGIAQGLALFPGISSMGLVLCAAIVAGFNRKNAIRLACLSLVPATVAAFIYELTDSLIAGIMSPYSIAVCCVGLIASAVTGILVIGRILRRVKRERFSIYAGYCVFAGLIAVLIGFAAG